MLRIPHCLDSQLTDGGEVVSPMHRPRYSPPNHNFSACGTHFCYWLCKPQGLVRPKGLGKLKKLIHLVGTRTREVTLNYPTKITPNNIWSYISAMCAGKRSYWPGKGSNSPPLPLAVRLYINGLRIWNLHPWRWGKNVIEKLRYPSLRLHGVAFRNIARPWIS
jgi:hypothetical protein